MTPPAARPPCRRRDRPPAAGEMCRYGCRRRGSRRGRPRSEPPRRDAPRARRRAPAGSRAGPSRAGSCRRWSRAAGPSRRVSGGKGRTRSHRSARQRSARSPPPRRAARPASRALCRRPCGASRAAWNSARLAGQERSCRASWPPQSPPETDSRETSRVPRARGPSAVGRDARPAHSRGRSRAPPSPAPPRGRRGPCRADTARLAATRISPHGCRACRTPVPADRRGWCPGS